MARGNRGRRLRSWRPSSSRRAWRRAIRPCWRASALVSASAPAVPTFGEYAARWLETVAALRVRPASLEQYADRLRLRILPTLGPVPLPAITRETLRALIGDMVQTGSHRHPGRPISRATVRETLATLSAVLRTAEEDALIPSNPARGLGRRIAATTATEAAEVDVFDREDIARLLAAAEADFPTWFPLVPCLARTGLRLGEALALQWDDVEWASRTLIIRRSRRRGRVSAPKNGKLRRVDLSAQLAAALRSLHSLQAAEAALAGRAPAPHVFLGPEGGPVHEDVFRVRAWAPLLRRVGLRHRKIHALRHSFASLLLQAGEPITAVSEALGHATPEFTLRVYSHFLPRPGRRAVDVLDDAPDPSAAAAVRNPAATAGAARAVTA